MWPFRKKAADLEVEEQELLTRLFIRARLTVSLSMKVSGGIERIILTLDPVQSVDPPAYRLATAGESQWTELLRQIPANAREVEGEIANYF